MRSSSHLAPRRSAGLLTVVAVAVVGAVVAAVGVRASGDVEGSDGPTAIVAPQAPPPDPAFVAAASADQPAVPDEILGDVVTVFERGDLSSAVRDRAFSAARSVGAGFGTGRGFTAVMSSIRRGDVVVQEAQAPGWAFPMAVTAFPVDVVRGLMGRDMAARVGGTSVVMGESSAVFHDVQVGDTIRFGIGPFVTYTVGYIAPDVEVGGTEILMSVEQAARIGGTVDTRVVIFPPFERDNLIAALTSFGLIGNSLVRVRTTWDDFDPDSTLSLIETKKALGEFDIDYANLTDAGWTAIDADWKAANLPADRELYAGGIRARCHFQIRQALRSALSEIATSYPWLINSRPTGIDVPNTNQYGGCSIGLARFSRFGASVGTISRHSWGQAIDMSTVDNCQGCVPQFSCLIVQTFRKYGFSWGGNYLRPDGMHFEWVGEPRHTYQYPSKYCPNPPTLQSASLPAFDPRGELFADDGVTLE